MVKNWHIDQASYNELSRLLYINKPKQILELGSGQTSILFSEFINEFGGKFLSLEHSPIWYDHTRNILGVKTGVVLAPLKETDNGFFYDYGLPDNIDFVLIDSPPLKFGRNATFYKIYPHLSDDFTVWLDDANRPHEKECLQNWQRDLGIKVEKINGRGVVITR